MSEWIFPPTQGVASRNRRLGLGLALAAVLYVIAVIVFIVFK